MKKKKILLTIVASLALGISIVVPAAHNGIGSRAGGGGVAECESGHHHGNHYLEMPQRVLKLETQSSGLVALAYVNI